MKTRFEIKKRLKVFEDLLPQKTEMATIHTITSAIDELRWVLSDEPAEPTGEKELPKPSDYEIDEHFNIITNKCRLRMQS